MASFLVCNEINTCHGIACPCHVSLRLLGHSDIANDLILHLGGFLFRSDRNDDNSDQNPHHPADDVRITAAATQIVVGLIVMWPPT